MEATERRNYPYYIKLGYTPPKGHLGNFVIAQSDGCPVTANLLSLHGPALLPPVFGLGFVGQPRNPLVFW
jgi:hypothetical protein